MYKLPIMRQNISLISILWILVTFLSIGLHYVIAFPMTNRRQHHNQRRPIQTHLFASSSNIGVQFFQDDDCEDLCETFADDEATLSSSLANNEQDIKETVPPSRKGSKPLRPIKHSLWSNPKPTKCKSCYGGGSHECRFCGGVSFLSGIGGQTDALFFDGIGKTCPVCDDGNEICHECSGTGYIFSWTNNRNSTDLLP